MISAERVRERLSYDPATGVVSWRSLHKMANKKFKVGDPAGYWTGVTPKRLTILLDGKPYLAHRLAWVLHYGVWPDGFVDHKDGNPANNRIDNLRIATPAENARNAKCKRSSRSGVKGVEWHAQTGKWRARIQTGGRNKHLGLFDTIEAARKARNEAAEKYHGEFARAA